MAVRRVLVTVSLVPDGSVDGCEAVGIRCVWLDRAHGGVGSADRGIEWHRCRRRRDLPEMVRDVRRVIGGGIVYAGRRRKRRSSLVEKKATERRAAWYSAAVAVLSRG